MKGERMRRLDLDINESSPVIGNFLSLHFSFSFFLHLSFCWVFYFLCLMCYFMFVPFLQEQCEVGSYPDF